MKGTQLTIDTVGNMRRMAATLFAQEVADILKDTPQDQHYFVLRQKAYEFLEKYESGLESLARSWKQIAEDAIACSLKPPIVRS